MLLQLGALSFILMIALGPSSGESPLTMHAPQLLRVLVVGSPIEAEYIRVTFRQNVPRRTVEDLDFISGVEAIVSGMAAALEEPFDLVVFPKGLLTQPQFFETFSQAPLLVDLTEQLPLLIDEGLIYIPLTEPGSAIGVGPVIGVELPWDSSYAIGIPSSTQRFDEALRVIRDLSDNVFEFFLREQQVRVYVKTNRFENHSDQHAYDIHLEYSLPVEDADPDRERWQCEVNASDHRKVHCTTSDDPVEKWSPGFGGGRIAIGVAFIGEKGAFQRCWWTAADGSAIRIDGALRC